MSPSYWGKPKESLGALRGDMALEALKSGRDKAKVVVQFCNNA